MFMVFDQSLLFIEPYTSAAIQPPAAGKDQRRLILELLGACRRRFW